MPMMTGLALAALALVLVAPARAWTALHRPRDGHRPHRTPAITARAG